MNLDIVYASGFYTYLLERADEVTARQKEVQVGSCAHNDPFYCIYIHLVYSKTYIFKRTMSLYILLPWLKLSS